MVDVVCYYPEYNAEHRMVLKSFARGCGAELRPVTDYRPCDVAVIYGWTKTKVTATHTKAPIIERHLPARSLLVIDSAPVLRGDYWAVTANGMGWSANPCRNNMTADRWKTFGVDLKPLVNKYAGDYPAYQEKPVVICGQVPWDANVQDTDHLHWVKASIKLWERMGHSVMFRPHPRIPLDQYLLPYVPVIDNGPLAELWRKAKAVITFNSTIGVDAAINGLAVVASDPRSFAWPVAGKLIDSVLAAPQLAAREQWAANLAYCQWNLTELASGKAWEHLKEYVPTCKD